jgi:hypothetical protein
MWWYSRLHVESSRSDSITLFFRRIDSPFQRILSAEVVPCTACLDINININRTTNDDHSVRKMSGNIPFAQPYPWNNPSMELAQQNASRLLRKRKYIGSGLTYLQETCLGPNSKMNKTAKNILVNLFHHHGMEIPSTSGTGKVDKTAKILEGSQSSFKSPTLQKRGEPQAGTSADDILRNASEGKYSLFKTMLRIVDHDEGIVHTKVFLSKACLVVQPNTIPGHMDAKDMVLAALHFLSTTYKPKSGELLELPMIRAVQVYSDLEKRSYQKAGTWKLDDIETRLLKLEELFLQSPAHWKWLKRETFCPRLTWEEETTFFKTGIVPARAEPKRKGEVRRRPRKTASAATSPTPSTVRTETPTPSCMADASVDGTATSVDDEDDDGPIVEAMILEDDDDEVEDDD